MKRFLFLIALFTFILNVRAIDYRGCDSSEIARMKALINNINISYDYTMSEYPIFSVTINNITPDLYFIDTLSKSEYHYQDTNNGEIVIGGYKDGISGKYKFYSAKSECRGVNLGSKYYKTPYYNIYYSDPLCEGLSINICDKWANVNYSKSEFENLIKEYKNRGSENTEDVQQYEKTFVEKILDFYVKYYLFILLFIIVSCSTIIYIKRKKDSFNL